MLFAHGMRRRLCGKSPQWRKLRRKRTWQPAGFCSPSGAPKNLLPCLSVFAGNSYPPLRCWTMLPHFQVMFARTDIGLEPGGTGFNDGRSGTNVDGEVIATKA